MLDWIFEGIVTWVSSIASELMDAVSRVFSTPWARTWTPWRGISPLSPRAFEVMQYMAWAVLFLITVWQLFRVFGGPITRRRTPGSSCCAALCSPCWWEPPGPSSPWPWDIARGAPYTALMEVSMGSGGPSPSRALRKL